MYPDLMPNRRLPVAQRIFEEIEAEVKRQIGGFMAANGCWYYPTKTVTEALLPLCNRWNQLSDADFAWHLRDHLLSYSKIRVTQNVSWPSGPPSRRDQAGPEQFALEDVGIYDGRAVGRNESPPPDRHDVGLGDILREITSNKEPSDGRPW